MQAAKEGKQPWAAVAAALIVLERAGPLDQNGLPWIKRAENESGISSNQLRRMTRTLRFVFDLAQTEPALAEALHWRGFSAVEVIAKIYAADRHAGTRIIREEQPGSSFRQLLKTFDEIRQKSQTIGGVAAGKLAAKHFVMQGQAYLSGIGASLLYRHPVRWDNAESEGEPHLLRVTRALRFATPDFLIFQSCDKQVRSLDAVDCHALFGDVDRATVERRAVQIATESTFFDRFLVLVPDGTAATIFNECFAWLGLQNTLAVNIEDKVLVDTLSRYPDRRPQFFPSEGGARRDAWLSENTLSLKAIVKAGKLDLILTS